MKANAQHASEKPGKMLMPKSCVYTAMVALLAMPLASGAASFLIPAGNEAALVTALTTANSNGEADTIELTQGTYIFDGTTLYSGDALPGVTTADPIEIIGNGSTLRRVDNISTPNFRFLTLAAGTNVSIESLSFENGSVENVDGGAINTAGTLSLKDCTFTNNLAKGTGNPGGGAIRFAGPNLTIASCTFTGNRLEGTDQSCFGAAIYAQNGGAMQVSESSFLYNSNTATVTTSMTAYVHGAGLYATTMSGVSTITDSLFDGNITQGTITGSGSCVFEGPALRFESASLSIDRCAFSKNRAFDSRQISSGNGSSAVGFQGFSFAKSLVVRNSIFYNNSLKSTTGGVVFAQGTSSSVIVQNITAIDNYPYDLALSNLSSGYVENCIAETVISIPSSLTVNNNFFGIGPSSNVQFVPSGTNRSSYTDGFAEIGDIVSTEPQSLGGNGLPVFPLIHGSIAVDGGTNTNLVSTTDQRGAGFPRIVNTTVDMGAYEYTSSTMTSTFVQADPIATNQDAVRYTLSLSDVPLIGLTDNDFQLDGSLASAAAISVAPLSSQNYAIHISLADPDQAGTVGCTILPSARSSTGVPVSGTTTAPLYTIRHVPGDLNNNGVVSASELNGAVLNHRGL